MEQTLLVHAIVAMATLYVGWNFMPGTSRRQFAARIGSLLRRCGLAKDRVLWLQAKASSSSGCGSCDSCSGCAIDKPVAPRESQPSEERQ